MKHMFVVGKYTLESLTNGMYSSPLDLYREYIQNAVDSIDDAVRNGLVDKKNSRIDISVNTEIASISIKDNGCGISPKRLETIFSGYTTSDEEMADCQKNAGIGLAVCATIIKAHGGSIKAENAKTGGAVFRFALNTEDDCHDA